MCFKAEHFFGILLLLNFVLLCIHAQGGCFSDGIFLPNGTVWHSEPCLQCSCHSGVTVCQNVECVVPECHSGEDLTSLPHECCPKCLPRLLPCVEGTETYKHGATWSLPPCLECQCYNGTVSCERLQCQIRGCPEGQVAVPSVGECCPQCVPSGRACKFESNVFEDGSIWSPISCTRCRCQKGLVQCYVAQCQSLSCPVNHTLETMLGECCPTCRGNSCIKDGIVHESGTTWEKEGDPCTHCSCTAGQINCFRTKCSALSCEEGQREMTLKGKCCPECVKKTGLCTLEQGYEVPHGTEIKLHSEECDTNEKMVCYCHHGHAKCSNVTCQKTSNCGHGMKLQTEWSDDPSRNSCGRCPKCVPDLKLCLFERRPRKNAETWSVGCSLCECVEGRISCYEPMCPSCGKKLSSPSVPASLPPALSVPLSAHSCCPECSPALCPSECLSCAPEAGRRIGRRPGTGGNSSPQRSVNATTHTVFCTICKEGLFLWEGQCVVACSGSTFPRGKRCLPCHQTCETCSEGTPFHCTSCKAPLSLRGGECVSDCGKGFYSLNGKCHPCHPTCEECSQNDGTECQSCSSGAYVFNGSCVEKCPPHHVARGGMCTKCPSNCMRCGANECLECQARFWRHDGKCLRECPAGYFAGAENECQRCHASCLTCNASGIASCSSCPRHLLQAGSSCVNSCPAATFRRDSVCIQCHPSCSECIHEGTDGCLRCRDPDKKVLPQDYERTIMKRNNRVAQKSQKLTRPMAGVLAGPCTTDVCPDEYKLYEGVCLAPHDGCNEWYGKNQNFCLKCKDGFLNENNVCVKECSPGFYEKGNLCLECSPHCATCSDGESDACESCAPWASLHRRARPLESSGSTRNISKCLTKCPKGHFFNSKDLSCRMCDPSCEDCATASTSGIPVCVKCKRKNEVLERQKCLASCSKGFFYSEDFGRCTNCHFSCLSCFGAGPHKCRSCPEGLFLTEENTCESSLCKPGFAVSQDGTCSLKCHKDCHSCSPDDLSTCTSCLDGKHLLNGKCVNNCPEMYFSDFANNGECKKCHWACKGCQGPSADDCLQCGTGKLHQGNRCVSKCSDGFYQNKDSCLPCPGGCKECSSKDECLACQPPYLLEKKNCVAECKLGYYSNIWENKCIECAAKCLRCTMFECLECEQSLLSQNGRCVEACDRDFYADTAKSVCHYNVERPHLFVVGVLNAEYEGPTVLNTSLIHVFDSDTQRDRISLIVEETPSNGEIFIWRENNIKARVSRRGIISYEAVEEGRVFFEYKKRESFHSYLKLKATDGQFESEAGIIGINVISSYSPEVVVLEPLIVRRRGKRTISGSNLKLRDVDSPETVVIRVLDGPASGRLTVGGEEENSFTIQQLAESQVVYEHLPKQRKKPHSGVDFQRSHTSDQILLQAGDGYNYLNFLLSILIVDSLKPAPVIVKNRGARVLQKQRVQITSDLLEAKDLDSSDGDIVYSIHPSVQHPSAGKFVLVIPLPTTPNGFINDGWIQMDESHLSRETSSFTQRDINEGRVWYVHSADSLGFPEGSSEFDAQYRDVSGVEYPSNEIIFSVSDSGNPPNVLREQTFIVQVDPLPHQEPTTKMEPLPGVEFGITVLEGLAVTITPSHLAFSGVNSNDHLVYIITHPLAPNEGSLLHIDYPGLELRQFTQTDINDMKIIYMPPLEDLGEEEKVVSFKFIISDEMKDEQIDLPEQKFTIKILPLKEELALLHPDPEIIVSSRGTVEIDSKYFLLNNSPEEEVTVLLLDAPEHGSLSLIAESEGRFSEDFTEETETTMKNILNSRVLYSNDGLKVESDFATFLFLRSSSRATTRISFKIILEDNLEPRPDKNASFVLRIKEGETKIISSKIVHFTDFHSDDEEIVYTLSSQPSYGDLLMTDDSGRTKILNQTHKLSQADISSGKLSYSSNVETGIEPVVDNILINVTDASNNALTNQLLRIQILPVDNNAPTLRVLSQIHVKEGATVPLTHELITFSDVDSMMSKLKLTVDNPPVFGYIMNSRLGASETKHKSNSLSLLVPEFGVQDLVDGKLHYVQSQHRHQEPTSDSFRIHMSDGVNESAEEEIKIIIEPVNDETPVILGEQVSVERGGTITIQNISLFISDSDTDADHLVVTVEQGPKHGTLHKKNWTTSSFKESVSIGEGDKFLFRDILQKRVFYSQDGSKATEDEMEIKVSDGVQETGGLLEFLVLPQKEKAPEMLVNKPLAIQRGQKATILPSILSATDEDSPDDNLVFVITVPPGDGTVQLYDDQDDHWKPLNLGSKFLQRDVTSGKMRYIHKNLKPELDTDSVQFHVQDPEGNVLLDKALTVTIQEDEMPPRITVNKGVTVRELSPAVISADVLSATDLEIDPMDITFRITESASFGRLELINNPEKSIKSWTQRDIELGSVQYRHTKYSSSFRDSFHFEVSDGTNKIYQSFLITITHVDEIPPYLVLKPIKVQEGTRKNISHYEIQAKDPDTSDNLLMFEINTTPKKGKIQKISDGNEITNTKMFSMQDIYEGRISYAHDGTSQGNDSFTITVSDPLNKGYLHLDNEAPVLEPSPVFVEVLSVSSGTPIIAINMGLQYLEHIDGKAQNSITSFELLTKDDDTEPDQLIYKITHPPEHGVLRLKTHTRPVSTFTQALINDGQLYYELTTFKEDITQDEFVFKVSDQESNSVSDNVFLISWSWVYMAQKEYNISESDGVVQIFIKKSGNTNRRSSVECNINSGGSHRSRKLFKKKKSEKAQKKEKKDYVALSSTVEFREGSSEQFCEVAIIDDDVLEGKETFSVKLTSAKHSLIGKPKKSLVTIFDEEDRPSLSFASNHYSIEESEGFIFVPVKRSGDIQVAASAYCVTKDGTAIGASTSEAHSDADYVSKNLEESSKIVFPPGFKLSTCDIKLIDDSNFEVDETFELLLVNPSKGVVVSDKNQTSITIKGPNDQSVLSFKSKTFEVVERSGKVRISIVRSGPGLDHKASIWCASKTLSPEQAKPNSDFIPFSKQITFQPGQDEAVFSINIIDDKGNPRYEGPESFVVFMSTPQNATLNIDFAEANVTIIDDEDIPSIQFEHLEVNASENDTVIKVPVIRSGDLSKPSSVRCFTRQRSAKGGIDFIERPNSDDSALTFPIGVSRVNCEVNLLDDLVYEKQEEFILKLSDSKSSNSRLSVGPNRITKILIEDLEDKPKVSFESIYYTTSEPKTIGEINNFQVPLIRSGDSSKSLKVMVSTREGSALNEVNFKPLLKMVNFTPGITREFVNVSILHSPSREWNKSFRVVLGPDEPRNGELGSIMSATVTIIDHNANEASVLPSLPVVVSLLHYDTAGEHYQESASPGYPLICLTSCEEQHPEYERTQQLCDQSGFHSDSEMKYSWEVAVPGEAKESLTPFHVLTESTLFGNASSKVLDSMFFARQFRVRCVVQPVLESGYLGIPLRSKPVVVSSSNAICDQPGMNVGLQGQAFNAKLSYINFTDEEHPNTVKIDVKIPHQDGMVPLISTLPLHNIRYLLTDNLYRAHHTCSNLKPPSGFFEFEENIQNITHLSGSRPYQWNEELRKNETLNLYRHLNLRTCTWAFTAYYSMSQLVDECGGQIVSDFQVGSAGQSFLTVRVPLYLSYTYASPAPGWTSLDHRTELSVSLYYSTLLWNQGLHTEPTLTAKIQISRIYLNSAGQLVIELSTIARYRGQFVLSHPLKPEVMSNLIAPSNLNLNFTLELLWSAASWDGPEQVWRATSKYTLRDYTGEYLLQLVPCTVFPSQSYKHSDPPKCIPQNPANFTLPLSIQQIQQPVPLVYSLNTNFQLFKSKEDFLLDPKKVDNLEEIDYKGNFGPSETVYGRVLWHPNQDLNSAYQLIIQRVFLCTGNDGYIPKYDPVGDVYNEGPQYGCIEDSTNLKHRFLILDREVSYFISNSTSPIEAWFAEESSDYDALKDYPGADGFLLQTDGLYKINSGYQWFLQVLYTIGPSQGNRGRREIVTDLNSTIDGDGNMNPENDTELNKFYGPPLVSEIQIPESLPIPASLQALHVRNGTNMRKFSLSLEKKLSHDTQSSTDDEFFFTSVLYIVLSLVFLGIVVMIVVLLVRRHYHKQERAKVIVVRSLKNEREEDRRKDDIKTKCIRPSGSPVTLNSESNLQTIKVKTLAVTVRNNLEEFGTEV